MNRLLLICALLAALLCGCLGQAPDPVKITRLDKSLEAYANLDSVARENMRDSLSVEINALFSVLGYPFPLDAELEWWSNSDEVRVFQPDIDAAFHSLSSLEQSLGYIMENAIRDSLPVEGTRFVAVAWGKPQPIIMIDSVMLIALNHYLGHDYPGYSHLQAYRRTEKEPEILPYDIAAVLASSTQTFNTSQTPTVLNWLLYEGALVEARMRLVNQPSLAKALGYRPDQLELMQDNLKNIKMEMAQKKMLYDTDPELISRLFSAAPNSPLLNGQAPGRAGRYIGYELVRSYMRKHPNASLMFLLSPDFYDNPQTLIEIGY